MEEASLDLASLSGSEPTVTGNATGQLRQGFDGPLDVHDAIVTSADFGDACVVDGRWKNNRVRSSRFANTRFLSSRLVGTVFEDCDLSGIQVLEGSLFDTVSFTRCKLSFSNWVDVTLTKVRFVECQMHESRFASCSVSDAAMLACDLTGSRFDEVTVAGATGLDLRTSTIDDTNGLPRVRGLRVDTTQAAMLGSALLAERGIEVGDPPEQAQ